MSSDPTELAWEGAAGLPPQRFLVLRVDSVEKDRGGLFGIRNSPSLAGSYPDATVITATGPAGKWRLRGPGAELAGLTDGKRVVVGLVDDGHFLCVLLPPSDLPDSAVAGWAAGQRCG